MFWASGLPGMGSRFIDFRSYRSDGKDHPETDGSSFTFLGFCVLQRHKERRATFNDHVSYSCVRDEGVPLGIGFQERVPNHSKRLRPWS